MILGHESLASPRLDIHIVEVWHLGRPQAGIRNDRLSYDGLRFR
jgi:hypothetical protein